MTRPHGENDPRDEGQAATELALVLPLLALLLLTVVQVTLVARDQILVVNAAREAAREAAVEPRPGAARAAAARAATKSLKSDRIRAETSHIGGVPGMVTVRIAYLAPTDVPLLGPLLPDVTLRASTTMRRESPPGRGEMSDAEEFGRSSPATQRILPE